MSLDGGTLALPGAGEYREPSLRRTVLAGALVIAAGFGGFFGWSFFATLDSAAIGSGVVIVDGHRKTIQHLEGGIVREILVREGDKVRAGQVLLRLDDTQAAASLGQLQSQSWAAKARAARLAAEQFDKREIVFPPELVELAGDPRVAEMMKTQKELFDARLQTLDSQIDVLRKKIAQSRQEITGAEAQQRAVEKRLVYTQEELHMVKELLDKGFERKTRYLDLQRSLADLTGRRGELLATEARAGQQIAQSEAEIVNLQDTRRSDAAKELQDTQAQIVDLEDKIRAALDVSNRKDVVAPQDGKVVDLKVFTVGGVVAAGAPLMDIVPETDDLIIEARVSPTDIDNVHAGLLARVRLTAYKQRKVPLIDGTVLTVSADALTDQKTNEYYYNARVRLDPASLGELHHVELYPGMPAEVYIVTGARRAIDYFISPLVDSMRRAFREE